MRPLFVVLLSTLLAPAAPVPKGLKAKKDDTELMVGLWVTTQNGHSFEYFADGTMRVWNGQDPGNGGGARYGWKLDPTTTPKRMTWTGTTPGSAAQYECVYELDGDSLKITYESAPKVPTAVGGSSQNHTMTRKPTAK